MKYQLPVRSIQIVDLNLSDVIKTFTIFLKRIALQDTIILKVIIAYTNFLNLPNHINTSKRMPLCHTIAFHQF